MRSASTGNSSNLPTPSTVFTARATATRRPTLTPSSCRSCGASLRILGFSEDVTILGCRRCPTTTTRPRTPEAGAG